MLLAVILLGLHTFVGLGFLTPCGGESHRFKIRFQIQAIE